MPKISFVMPAKNRGEIIHKSIESIIGQTFSDWELVIIDDHSNPEDQTLEVVRKFSDKRIKFFRMPQAWSGGIPEARNFGNAMALGEIIAVADSDDLAFPHRAELTVLAFENEKCDVFFGKNDVLYQETGEVVQIEQDQTLSLEVLKTKNIIPHSSSAYKREIAYQFPYNSFFRRGEDYDLFIRLFRAGKKFFASKEKIFRYVVHSGSTTRGGKTLDFNQIIYMNNSWDDYAQRAKVLEEMLGIENELK